MIFLMFIFWFSVFFILYAYLGYPLLIGLLAWVFSKPDVYIEHHPSITFMIPAYNEEKYISEKLENTLSLDYPANKIQILVVADGSSDDTVEKVESYRGKGVELSYIPDRNGKMAAIVRGMNDARGEIVIFSDANNMYDSQAVRELILPFSDPHVGATTGAKFIIEDGRDLSSAEGLYWKYESFIKKSESSLDSCVSSVGEILAIRGSAFVAPTEKIINDDHYIILKILRQGYRVIYTPLARSFEKVSQTAHDEVERRTRMNVGLFQTIAMSGQLLPFKRPLLVWQIFSHKYSRAFVPFAMLLAFFSNLVILLAFQTEGFRQSPLIFSVMSLCFVLQLIFYTLALIGTRYKSGGWMGKLLYLPVFLVNSNYAALGGFFNFFANKQSHVWKRVNR
jgi:biofilm PGA synthesis N-glycosyltransferase PgaC